ncbi:MAG: transcription termination/antitermination factor NusG [Candidatus Delongbacteria bacterium]|nr:transcription termination/antitermination factor NusG [Candidatus Delongbacteria bacterium]
MMPFAEDEKKPVETNGDDRSKPLETEPEETTVVPTDPEVEAAAVEDSVSPEAEVTEVDAIPTLEEVPPEPTDTPDQLIEAVPEELSPSAAEESAPDTSSIPELPDEVAEIAESPLEPVKSDLKWYTLQVFTSQEEKVKKYIEIETARQGLEEHILNVHIPTQNVVEIRAGKKKITARVSFPGYMFVQMEINKNTRHFIRNAPSVMGFVGPDGEPVALSEKEVARIIGRGEADTSLPETQFNVGDRVKVVDGPFLDFEGVVQECQPERKRLKVLVSIFGRNTPLDLAFFQVTAIEEE